MLKFTARGEPNVVHRGEGGIRTPGRLAPTTVFKTAAIDHSATSPIYAL